jgi:GNAT superfamily N-acetyltransferase
VAGYASEADQLEHGLWATFETLMPLVDQGRAAAAELGLTERGRVVGMVAAPSGVTDVPAAAVGVRRVDEEGLRLALDVAAAGFGSPTEAIDVLYTPRILSAPGVSFYLAEVDGEPVATGVGCIGEGLVGVYSVATPPEHRRRGYGSAVVVQIVTDGFDAGAQLAYLQASAMGASVYAKLGFRRVLDWDWLTRPNPADQQTSLRQDVREPHERHDLAELGRCAPQAHPAAMPAGGELKARQRVDRHRVGLDAGDVAERDPDAALLEQRTHPRGEAGQVGARNRAFDCEGKRLRRCGGHCDRDPATGQNSSQTDRRPLNSGAARPNRLPRLA